MKQKSKKTLIVNRKAPFGTSYARDSLDVVLANAAFEQDISVLFMDDGVFQLQNNQQGKSIGLKGIEAGLPAFAVYGIDKLYAESHSLKARSMASDNLLIEVKALDDNEIKSLFAEYDIIINF